MRLRPFLLALCLPAIPAVATAEIPLAPESPADAIRWAFDQADSIEVFDFDASERRMKSVRLRVDEAWRREVSQLIENASFKPESYCFCMTPPLVFYRDRQRLATLSVHHNIKVRFSVDPQFGEVSGDFFVGEPTARGIVRAAFSRREAHQAIRASAEAAAAAVLNR